MYVYFDNLAAMLVASVLILLLLVATVRQQQTATESTLFYSTVTHTESFAQTVRRDLQSITEIYTPGEDADSLFRFQARIGNDPAPHEITYRREFSTRRDSTDYYRIVRLVDGVEAGGSTDLITVWMLEVQNDQGQAITSGSGLDDARQVLVRIEMRPQTAPLEVVEQLSWESTFYPPLRSDNSLL